MLASHDLNSTQLTDKDRTLSELKKILVTGMCDLPIEKCVIRKNKIRKKGVFWLNLKPRERGGSVDTMYMLPALVYGTRTK